MKRYSVGDAAQNFGPPFAVLDDREREAIALCWHREKAEAIVDALNAEPVLDFGELKGGGVIGDAFLGGMFGSLAGAMIDRKLRELPQGGNPPPPPMTEPERRAYFAKLKKNAKAAKAKPKKKGGG